jgi:hypothetical protein
MGRNGRNTPEILRGKMVVQVLFFVDCLKEESRVDGRITKIEKAGRVKWKSERAQQKQE